MEEDRGQLEGGAPGAWYLGVFGSKGVCQPGTCADSAASSGDGWYIDNFIPSQFFVYITVSTLECAKLLQSIDNCMHSWSPLAISSMFGILRLLTVVPTFRGERNMTTIIPLTVNAPSGQTEQVHADAIPEEELP